VLLTIDRRGPTTVRVLLLLSLSLSLSLSRDTTLKYKIRKMCIYRKKVIE